MKIWYDSKNRPRYTIEYDIIEELEIELDNEEYNEFWLA